MPVWGHVAAQAHKSLSVPHAIPTGHLCHPSPLKWHAALEQQNSFFPFQRQSSRKYILKPSHLICGIAQVSCQLGGGWQAHMGFQPLSNTTLFDSLLWWAAQEKSTPKWGWMGCKCLFSLKHHHSLRATHSLERGKMPQRGCSTGSLGLYVLGDSSLTTL